MKRRLEFLKTLFNKDNFVKFSLNKFEFVAERKSVQELWDEEKLAQIFFPVTEFVIYTTTHEECIITSETSK